MNKVKYMLYTRSGANAPAMYRYISIIVIDVRHTWSRFKKRLIGARVSAGCNWAFAKVTEEHTNTDRIIRSDLNA